MERGTHAHRASKLGPVERWWTQDGKLGITIQDLPQSPEDRHICYVLLVRIAFCHMSKNLPIHCLFLFHYVHLFLFSMLILYVTSLRFWLYLLNSYHFTYKFSHAHTEAHTHKPLAHMYNQHTRGMATTRHRSLVERGGRKAFIRDKERHCTQKKQEEKNASKKLIFTNQKKRRIQAHRIPSTATRLFLTK